MQETRVRLLGRVTLGGLRQKDIASWGARAKESGCCGFISLHISLHLAGPFAGYENWFASGEAVFLASLELSPSVESCGYGLGPSPVRKLFYYSIHSGFQ